MMKRTNPLIYIILFCILISFITCKKGKNPAKSDNNDGPDTLSNNYTGTLTLQYSNEAFPAFDESIQLTVEVFKNGDVTFGTGILLYDAEQNDSEFKIRRTGMLNVAPEGFVFEDIGSGEKIIVTNENIQYTDHMIHWVWNRNSASWVETLNEMNSGLWNEGLVFYIENSVIQASVVERAEALGTIRWTLILVPE